MKTPLEELRLKLVIVVGAGQAALAMGFALAHTGVKRHVDFMILAADIAENRTWTTTPANSV